MAKGKRSRLLALLAAVLAILLVISGCSDSSGGGAPPVDSGDEGSNTEIDSDGNVKTYKASMLYTLRGTTVAGANGVYTVTIGDGEPSSDWNDQVKITLDDKSVAKDRYWQLKAKLTSSVAISRYIVKGTNAEANVELFYNNGAGSLVEATAAPVVFAGKCALDSLDPVVVLFDFGYAPAGATIKIEELSFTLVDDPSKLPVESITVAASNAEVAVGGKVTLTVKDSNGFDVTESATFALAEGGDALATLEGNVLTVNGAGDIAVTATYMDKTASVTVKGVVPEDVVIYSSGDGTSVLGAWENWWNGPTVTDSDDTEKTGKKITFSATDNGSGGYAVNVSFGAGAKLTMDVWADQNFQIKPVAPDTPFPFTVKTAGTYEKVSVEIELGEAGSLKQIGFIGDVANSTIYVDNIKVVQE